MGAAGAECMERWLAEVPGLDPGAAQRAQDLFRSHSVGAALLDFLASEEGLQILESWRRRGSNESQRTGEHKAPEQAAGHEQTGADGAQGVAAKANQGRQRISTADRRLGNHYFAAAERPARGKEKAPEKQQQQPPAPTVESLRAPFYAQAHEGPKTVQVEGPKDRLQGTLKSFCEDTGYGFIHCEQLSQDIFLSSAERPEDGRLEPGRLVEFTLAYDSQKRPKARNASWLAPVAPPASRFFGRVKSVGSGYGFIECARTYKLYGRDVYFTTAQLSGSGLEPSQLVSFDVTTNSRGQPQAKGLKREEQDFEPASDAGSDSGPAPLGDARGPAVVPSPAKKHW